MKHFKLNTERNLVPVADLCIADVARTDYPLVMQTFADALHDHRTGGFHLPQLYPISAACFSCGI